MSTCITATPDGGDGLVLVTDRPVGLGDHLDANERQEGQYGSSKQVRAFMPGDRGYMRAMRLLPFAAAVNEMRMPEPTFIGS